MQKSVIAARLALLAKVVEGLKLRALTDAAFAHLGGTGKRGHTELEYSHYPRKIDMPVDVHKA